MWCWCVLCGQHEENLAYYAHPLSDRDFNKAIGQYCATVFVRGTTRALTATSLGNIVIWDSDSPGGSSRHARLRTSAAAFAGALAPELNANKKPLKILKVQEKAITVLTRVDDYIVTGDVLGRVRFFDLNVKLLYWIQDLELGPINALSFTYYAEGERSYAPLNFLDHSRFTSSFGSVRFYLNLYMT